MVWRLVRWVLRRVARSRLLPHDDREQHIQPLHRPGNGRADVVGTFGAQLASVEPVNRSRVRQSAEFSGGGTSEQPDLEDQHKPIPPTHEPFVFA